MKFVSKKTFVEFKSCMHLFWSLNVLKMHTLGCLS